MSSSPAPDDPYKPPQGVEPKPSVETPGAAGVRYMYIYSYIFENPNWMMNVVYGFLCFLSAQVIPIIGQLLYMGYLFEVTESLIRQPGRTYPDFDFNKFSYYLQRSLWPFLVSLILTLPIMLVVVVICGVEFAAVVAAMGAAGKDSAPFVLLGGMLMVVVTFLGLTMLACIPLTPFFIRAGLSQDFGEAFKFSWAMDFLKRVWLELFLFNLFYMVTMLPIVLIGYACCVVGVFASLAISFLASASMYTQLYNLYLARGGEPIPLKDPPPTSTLATA